MGISSAAVASPPNDFLAGGGEAGAHLRAHCWRQTSIGLPDAWPASLKTVIRVMLNTNHPVFVFWGSEHLCFYNDAYAASLGPEKHPAMIGAPGRQMWPEIWPIIGPQIDQVMAGGDATWHENELVPIIRHGALEDVWWTYSYSPIHDDDAPNGVGGVLVLVSETTQAVAAAARSDFLVRLSDALRDLYDDQSIAAAAAEGLGREMKAARILIAAPDAGGCELELIAQWTDENVKKIEGLRAFESLGSEISKNIRTGRIWRIEDAEADDRGWVRACAPTFRALGVRASVGIPLMRGERPVAVVAVQSAAPRRWSDADVEFIHIVAARAWASIERARAENSLTDREEQLRLVIDAAPALIAYVDREKRYRFNNKAYCDWFGLRKSDIAGRALREVLGEEAFAAIEARIDAALAGEESEYIGVLDYRLGGQRHVRARYVPHHLPDGGVAGIFVFVDDISEAKRAERAIAESEARFREVADSTPTPVWMTDKSGALVFSNAQFTENTGKTAKDVAGDGWISLIHPDDLEQVGAARAVAWEKGCVAYTYDARFRRHDGAWRWMEVTSRPRIDSDGAFQGYIGMAVDRTAAVVAERTLAESERRFRLLTQLAPVIVFFANALGEIEFMNQRWTDYTSQPVDEALGDGWASVVHPDDAPAVLEKWRDPATREGVYELRYRNADGDYCWHMTRVEALKNADDDIVGWFGAGANIHDHKRAEEVLAESEARFRALADDAPVMVWVADASAACTYLSRSWCEFTGQSREAALGGGWMTAIHPDDRADVHQRVEDANARKAPYRLEYRLRRRDGDYRWVIDSARPRFGGDGDFLGYVGSVIDFDERKRAEEHRKLLVEELNHRVKNTLAVVQSLARQSFAGDASPDEMRRAFEGRLAALSKAHNLLTETKWETADLGIVARAALHLGGEQSSRIAIEGPAVALKPKTAVTIAMALHELRTNAMKYGALSNDNGTVSLEWSVGEEDGLSLMWRESGGPRVKAPKRRGFGMRMIEEALAAELAGEAQIDFRAGGVVCEIRAPAFS